MEDLYSSENDPYYPGLSNLFFAFEGLFEIKNTFFPSVENAYQYFRFMPNNPNDAHKEFAQTLLSMTPPDKAREIASNPPPGIYQRVDWEDIREDVMLECLRAKFTQDEECRKLLLQTKNDRLHCITHALEDNDSEEFYWGTGANSLGRDRLGSLLMIVREELKINV